MKKPLLVLVARRRRRSFIGSLIFKFLMQKSFKNKFSWPNHPLISCIAYVILLFVEFKLCRLCPLIVLTLSFSCVSFDFLLCEIQIVLTLAFCCVHFDFFNFCRLCPSIVLTLSFYCVDFKCHMFEFLERSSPMTWALWWVNCLFLGGRHIGETEADLT